MKVVFAQPFGCDFFYAGSTKGRPESRARRLFVAVLLAICSLADKAVGESRERFARRLGLGLALPPQRISVNLSPADLAKEGSHYDLPIALGLLAAMGVIERRSLEDFVVLGEWR